MVTSMALPVSLHKGNKKNHTVSIFTLKSSLLFLEYMFVFSVGCHKKQFTWFWTYLSSFFFNTVMCLNIGTPKITNFSFGTNGKLKIIGVQIFKHFRYVFVWIKNHIHMKNTISVIRSIINSNHGKISEIISCKTCKKTLPPRSK